MGRACCTHERGEEKFWWEDSKEKNHLEDLDPCRRIILKFTLKE
jgi:hypothetical protein